MLVVWDNLRWVLSNITVNFNRDSKVGIEVNKIEYLLERDTAIPDGCFIQSDNLRLQHNIARTNQTNQVDWWLIPWSYARLQGHADGLNVDVSAVQFTVPGAQTFFNPQAFYFLFQGSPTCTYNITIN